MQTQQNEDVNPV